MCKCLIFLPPKVGVFACTKTSQGRNPEKKFLSLDHKALLQVHDVLPEADDGDGLPAGQPPVELLQGEADAGGQGAELGRGS